MYGFFCHSVDSRTCSKYEQFPKKKTSWKNKIMKSLDWSHYFVSFMVNTKQQPCQEKQYSARLADIFHMYCYAIIIHQIVYGYFRFPDYDEEHPADVASQQRILTLPRHLLLLLFLQSGVLDCPVIVLYVSFGVLILFLTLFVITTFHVF